jgi:hypothetical protein
MYTGSAVRDYGACPRVNTAPCTPACQATLNELGVYCTATAPINTPANVLAAFGITCIADTCVLDDAASSTAAAMFLLGVPLTCTSPFDAPMAKSAASWRAAPRLALAAAAAAALL